MPPLPANPLRALAGTDPGRVRLSNAVAVATTVLLSTGSAVGITHLTHGSSGLVVVGAFLAMISGLSVKDGTAHGRLTTTVLLAVPAVAVLTATTLLDRWRFVEFGVLIAICTAAVWVRAYGPRWSALGMIAFISGFFGLVIRPSIDELGPLTLIVIATTACNVAVKLAMLPSFPRHELRLLLREFRGTRDACLGAATARNDALLQKMIDRVGDVAIAINGWQGRYDTHRLLGLDGADLSRLVFDARTDAVQACLQLAAHPTSAPAGLVGAFHRTLQTETAPDDAQHTLASPDTDFVAAVVARAVVSQIALQKAVATGRVDQAATPAPIAASEPDQPKPSAGRTAPAARTHFWETWRPTSRMAVQVFVATTVATAVGEAISATRWYWAVLTAFLVFIGTTTRGGVLTRAYRRVLGTTLGVIVGFAVAWIANGNSTVLALCCVVCVFFVIYLGPLNYAVLAFFITVLIASMYGLLGVLDRQVLEWRVEETAAGSIVGVAAAFLIFSTSSTPPLAAEISSYFDALDRLLLRTGRALTGTGDAASVVSAALALDAAHNDLQTFVSLMRVSLIARGRRPLRQSAMVVINAVGVQAERMAEESIVLQRTNSAFSGDDAIAVSRGIDAIRAHATTACTALVTSPRGRHAPADAVTLDCIDQVSAAGDSPQFRALLAMSEISYALQHLRRLRERSTGVVTMGP
ncbi:FUSC family protein [Gordonia liuliyuniae]|uniref:FUSC family protein n=1 Tax=Gordonia liuliyuniae TaxID=2911517 RepID=A0ABS9IU02_9ACTN|nr:FUSC family protein [Gordonia liuliyuniae]MCF8589043.1 FUSC family protein [Gordonia liuliyuniae]